MTGSERKTTDVGEVAKRSKAPDLATSAKTCGVVAYWPLRGPQWRGSY